MTRKDGTIRSPRAGKRRATITHIRTLLDALRWVQGQLDVGARVWDGRTHHTSDDSICESTRTCTAAEFDGHSWNGRVRQLDEYPENNPAKLLELAQYVEGVGRLADELAADLRRQAASIHRADDPRYDRR